MNWRYFVVPGIILFALLIYWGVHPVWPKWMKRRRRK